MQPRISHLQYGALIALLMALPGCDTESPDAEAADDSAADSSSDTETTALEGPCDNEDRAMVYSAGLEVMSDKGLVRATLMDATPAPPARYINNWNLQFEMTGDGSLVDVDILVLPFMPDHEHGSATPIIQGAGEALGSVDFADIDLFMVGYWDVHFDLTAADGSWSDRVSFGFCVE